MKKLWNQYCYAIILIGLSCVLTLMLADKSPTSIEEDYLSIKVEEGDSLWKLSKTYAEEHQLSPKEFINWVKQANEIDDALYVGDSIVIPVKKDRLYIASSGETE
ncbi:LysM peptidoglycan-binding domain-containing protein [Robertmurraya massiliosenegalensis]|uniref:cell division suppressor protein YneA n=1 Tax=Robertmurraya TaxID=2837507 RepID=UPI0039A66291